MVCFKQTNFAEKQARLSSQFFLEYVDPFDLLFYADETHYKFLHDVKRRLRYLPLNEK